MATIDSDYVQSMATQLANYEVQSSLSRLNRNEANYKAQREALSSLRSSLTTFSSAIKDLNRSTSSMLVNSASFSQEGYATASLGTTAQPGSYDFLVEQLASRQQTAVSGLTDADLGSGTLTIGQGGKTFNVDLSKTSTLDALASAINASGAGVQATLVRSDGVVNLVLGSEETGAAQAFTLSSSNATVQGRLDAATSLATAQDARVRLGGSYGAGGIELTSASNTFSNIIEGVSLTFSKTHAAKDLPLTVTIGQDQTATKGQAQKFVDAFNTLMGSFDSLTASGSDSTERGALAGDSSIRSIESRLNQLLRTDFGGRNLIGFGISADRNGKLTLDATRFEAAIKADPEGFEALFKGEGNLLESVDKTLTTYTSSTNGLLKNRMDTLDLSLRRVDEQFDKLQQQYDSYYTRYLGQFTTMMQTMQAMEQTNSMFTGMSQ